MTRARIADPWVVTWTVPAGDLPPPVPVQSFRTRSFANAGAAAGWSMGRSGMCSVAASYASSHHRGAVLTLGGVVAAWFVPRRIA